MSFAYIHPPRSSPTFLSTQPHPHPYMCVCVCICHTRCHTIKENWLFLSHQYSNAKSSLARSGTSCPLPLSHAGVLSRTISLRSQLLWVHMCTCSAASGKYCFLEAVCYVWLVRYFHQLIHDDPWTLRGGLWYGCPRRAEQPGVLYSLPLDQLWVSMLIAVYCKKGLLWWGLRNTLGIYGFASKSLRHILRLCRLAE